MSCGRRDQQDLADARQHQHRQRIVDHRLVVDRQQLLADRRVTGYSRVPEPPARMIPFEWSSLMRLWSFVFPSQAQAFALIGRRWQTRSTQRGCRVPCNGRRAQCRRRNSCSRPPAQRSLDLAGVDGVAAVVAGAVLDESRSATSTGRGAGPAATRSTIAADGPHHVEVRLFAVAADVVGLARLAAGQHPPQRPAMVLDIQPVADLLPVAVDRQRLPLRALRIISGISFSGNW